MKFEIGDIIKMNQYNTKYMALIIGCTTNRYITYRLHDFKVGFFDIGSEFEFDKLY